MKKMRLLSVTSFYSSANVLDECQPHVDSGASKDRRQKNSVWWSAEHCVSSESYTQGVSVPWTAVRLFLRSPRAVAPSFSEGIVGLPVTAFALMVFRPCNYTQRSVIQAKTFILCLTLRELATYVRNKMCCPHVTCWVALLSS